MVKVGNPPTAFRTRLLAALLPARRLRTGHAEDGGQHVVSQHLDQPGHRAGGAEHRGGARVDRDAPQTGGDGDPDGPHPAGDRCRLLGAARGRCGGRHGATGARRLRPGLATVAAPRIRAALTTPVPLLRLGHLPASAGSVPLTSPNHTCWVSTAGRGVSDAVEWAARLARALAGLAVLSTWLFRALASACDLSLGSSSDRVRPSATRPLAA